MHVGEDIRVDSLQEVTGCHHQQGIVAIAAVEVFVVLRSLKREVGGVLVVVDGAEPLEVLFEHKVVIQTAQHYAVIDG